MLKIHARTQGLQSSIPPLQFCVGIHVIIKSKSPFRNANNSAEAGFERPGDPFREAASLRFYGYFSLSFRPLESLAGFQPTKNGSA
jgi:hypothetical protein